MGNFMGWNDLASYLGVFTSSCVIQLAICLFKADVFEIDASAIESSMSGT